MKYSQILATILLTLALGLFGCTSKNVEKEDMEVSELTGESTEEFGDEDSADDFGSDDFAADDFSGDATGDATEGFADSDDSMGFDEAEDDSGVASYDDFDSEEGADEFAADTTDAAPSDDFGLEEDSFAASDSGADTDWGADSATDSGADTSMAYADDSMSGFDDTPAPRPMIPLRKMATTPYTKAGVLVNAIYIAREGDSLDSVSQKIYGTDRVGELKSVNGHVANRNLKVGDKIYYNSPQRPTDNSQVLVYYEDVGLTAEVYPVQGDGENIRTLSSRILGHPDSWKEIWSTNMDVESKDVLPQGTRLRYWSTEVAGVAAPALAAARPDFNEPSEPTPSFEPPPPAPETEMPVADAPAYDDMQGQPDMAMGSTEPSPPPPSIEPPPPVALDTTQASAEVAGLESMLEGDDQMLLISGGVLLLIGVMLMIIIIRKKRARRSIDFQTATHTNIE